MSETFSEFHDLVCQSSQLLYTDHFDESIQFYEKLGFTQRHKESDLLCVLRMKHTYIELWNQKHCKVNTTSPENIRDQHHRSIVIYVRNKKALMTIHKHVNKLNINTHDDALDESYAPLGYCFSVNDPDNNLITFATGPVWTYPYEYEHNCYQRAYGDKKATHEDEKDTPTSNVLYPDFNNDDDFDFDMGLDPLDDDPE